MAVVSAVPANAWHELVPGLWPGKDYLFIVGSPAAVGTTLPLGIVGPPSIQTLRMDRPSTQHRGDKSLNVEVCAGKRGGEGAF